PRSQGFRSLCRRIGERRARLTALTEPSVLSPESRIRPVRFWELLTPFLGFALAVAALVLGAPAGGYFLFCELISGRETAARIQDIFSSDIANAVAMGVCYGVIYLAMWLTARLRGVSLVEHYYAPYGKRDFATGMAAGLAFALLAEVTISILMNTHI